MVSTCLISITSIALLAVLSSTPSLGQQRNQTPGKQDLPAKVIQRPQSIQKEVSFQTEDGWRIHGTYTVPASHREGVRLPATLLLHSSMHSQIVWGVYPGWLKVQEQIVTLRIDLRGRGKSEGSIPFVDFSRVQREAVIFDVKAGLDFLNAQPEVDRTRLGIVAEGFSAGPAIMGAVEDPRARVFVLISGLLDQKALDLLASNSKKPVLFIVSKEDKPSFAALTKAYVLTKSLESDIWVQDGLGSGLSMGSVWRNRYPDQPEEKAIDVLAGEWLVSKLRRLGHITEIKLQTPDGWTLYANLGLPDNINATNAPLVPGVILLPTALSDRTSFHTLEQLLVINNIAVLNLDWRGIGKSVNKGTLIDLPGDVFARALSDVQEAHEFLTTLKGVDPERIGILGGAVGAKLAMAVSKDVKVKAIALLSPITKPQELANDRETIVLINRPILLVTSDGLGEATKEVAEFVARDKRHTVKTYPGGLLGYALFSVDNELEPAIAQWFKAQLGDADKPLVRKETN